MCGIAGIFDLTLSQSELGRNIQQMTGAIVHRGPDDEGHFVGDNVGLGMRRLSIIDLEGGHQPIFNEQKDVVLVFNGEIYNYRELRKELQQRGHVFTTDSDTEVIVHLYEEAGDKCVHRLRGMFAFAIWDARRQRLFIARDRLGIKPLYFARDGERLVFASEIKAVLRNPHITAETDLYALSDFLSLKYVPAPRTLFAGIQSLPPGHTLTCDGQGVSVQRWWDLSFDDRTSAPDNEEAYTQQLDELLRESVRLRLRSDVPFGAFLSGGIDSSMIVALMSEMLDEPVKTFSIGFEGPGDELPYARLVARKFRTDHHEIVIKCRDYIDMVEEVIWHMDQPIADQATVATHMLSRLAAEHVKMVLTGEGGDELFAGYARYGGERFAPLFNFLPSSARSLAIAVGNHLPGMRRAKLALYALCQPDETARFTNWFPLFNRDLKNAVWSQDSRNDNNGYRTDGVFGQHLSRTDATHPLNRMLYVDTKLWLPDFLLLRGDKLSMSNSLEARVPLLDHKLAEFAASLPPQLKLKGRTHKYLLKKVARKYLPPEIIARKKQGFPIPMTEWFRGEARSFLHDILSPSAIRKRNLFDAKFVARLLNEHDKRFADHGIQLCGLMSIELWHRLFIDSPPSGEFGVNRASDFSVDRTSVLNSTTNEAS